MNKQDFLDMPEGTVYQKYEPYITIEGLCIKEKTIGDSDWFLTRIDLISILGDTNDIIEKCDSMMKGESAKTCICIERDGMFDPDDMFLVLEKSDLKKINHLLKQAERQEVEG